MIKVGDRLNSFTVLAVAVRRPDTFGLDRVPDAESGLVILARRESDGEYVTARMSHDVDTSWFWGNYIDSSRPNDAWNDFAERVTGVAR